MNNEVVVLPAPTPAQVEVLRQRIMSYDLSIPRNFLLRTGVPTEKVAVMEAEYRKYILLNLAFPDGMNPICYEVDEFWHTHVLHTEYYEAFCNTLTDGGIFLHHRPAPTPEEKEILQAIYDQNTIGRLTQLFGSVNRDVWKPNAQVCLCCCAGRYTRDALHAQMITA